MFSDLNTDRAPRKDVISRVRPRFETGYVLTTRHAEASISNPTEAADVLREAAADAETLRDTLDDWITGHYGIADNDNGELGALRCIVGNMSIAMSNAAHVLDKCDAYDAVPVEAPVYDTVPVPVSDKVKRYPLGNMAECLNALEQCGDDAEFRDAIARKLRTWTGIERGYSIATHTSADELEALVMSVYDNLGELLGEAQAIQHKELYNGIMSARSTIEHTLSFF